MAPTAESFSLNWGMDTASDMWQAFVEIWSYKLNMVRNILVLMLIQLNTML